MTQGLTIAPPTPREQTDAEFISAVMGGANASRPPARLPETGETIHYTELPAADPTSVLAEEWETFRRELGRLLAEGHEGRFVLVKGRNVIGIWDTFDEALAEGHRRFPFQPVAVQSIRERQPVLRLGSAAWRK